MAIPVAFDPKELESKVKTMYRSVAENPDGEFHFEMGRAMAERLGYAAPISIASRERRSSHSPVSATISILPISRKAKPSSIWVAVRAWTRSLRR
jgi:hypothetical protein